MWPAGVGEQGKQGSEVMAICGCEALSLYLRSGGWPKQMEV